MLIQLHTLTKCGNVDQAGTVIVNTDHIVSVIEAYNGANALVTLTDGKSYRVVETVEGVFAMTREETR